MPHWKTKIFAWIVFVFSYSSLLQAQTPLLLHKQSSGIALNGQTLYYYEDVAGNLSFEEVQTRTFGPVMRKRNSFGSSSSVFWFRFKLKNTSKNQRDWRLEVGHPLLDHIQLYIQQGKNWKKLTMGDNLPFDQRPIYSRNFVVPLKLTDSLEYTYYLKIQSTSTIQVPLTIYTPGAFHQKQDDEQLFFGIYYGILLVMALYNFIIYSALRERSYLFYMLFIVFAILFNLSLDGHDYQYLWPRAPQFSSNSAILFGGLAGFFLLLYANYFLETEKYAPKLGTGLVVFAGINLVNGLMALVAIRLATQLMPIIFLLSFPWMIFTALICFRKGMLAARYFLWAWTLLALGVIGYSLTTTDIIPSNNWTMNLSRISLVLAVMLLSRALAERYRQYKREKENVQQKILDMQLDANEKLEKKVVERTREIQFKSDEILTQNEELQQQQEEIIAQNEFIEETHAKLKQESKKTRESIRAAKLIQKAALPSRHKLRELFEDRSFIVYYPKDLVSGDFYWVTKVSQKFKVEDLWKNEPAETQEEALQMTTKSLKPKEMILAAAIDCTGHGVPGAFMSMIGISLLNEIVNEGKLYETDKILTRLHERVQAELNQEENAKMNHGMDVCLCRLEQTSEDTTQVIFTGSKRPLYYIKDGVLGEIKGDRVSIGGYTSKNRKGFTTQTMEFKKGDMLYLTTDGFVDMPNEKRKSFGTRRLKMMLQTYHNLPVREQRDEIVRVMRKYMERAEQRDDITIFGIQI
ncbi:MAG TPA: serine/threonine protein kinase [Microscillaceae bacterium]|nr:serine/threonine protein kinase [Microscillaceae bacterium]